MCAKVYIRLHKLKYEVRACTDGVLTVLSYIQIQHACFKHVCSAQNPKLPKGQRSVAIQYTAENFLDDAKCHTHRMPSMHFVTTSSTQLVEGRKTNK